jgi:hypothetical protein
MVGSRIMSNKGRMGAFTIDNSGFMDDYNGYKGKDQANFKANRSRTTTGC